MLIAFSLSMLGFLLVHRKFLSISQEFAFSQIMTRKILLSNLVLITTIFLFFSSSPAILWLVIGILLITLNFFPQIIRFFLIRKLRQSIISSLDMMILSLQAGKSMQFSIQEAFQSQHGWVRKQLMQLCESMQRTDERIHMKTPLLKNFRLELIEIYSSQSRCVDQVKALRRQYKMVEDFRRRSGQVVQQIKMQAIIVTALYLGLLAFVVSQFGFVQNQKVISLSLAIFAAGLLWIFNVGKRMKWKV